MEAEVTGKGNAKHKIFRKKKKNKHDKLKTKKKCVKELSQILHNTNNITRKI